MHKSTSASDWDTCSMSEASDSEVLVRHSDAESASCSTSPVLVTRGLGLQSTTPPVLISRPPSAASETASTSASAPAPLHPREPSQTSIQAREIPAATILEMQPIVAAPPSVPTPQLPADSAVASEDEFTAVQAADPVLEVQEVQEKSVTRASTPPVSQANAAVPVQSAPIKAAPPLLPPPPLSNQALPRSSNLSDSSTLASLSVPLLYSSSKAPKLSLRAKDPEFALVSPEIETSPNLGEALLLDLTLHSEPSDIETGRRVSGESSSSTSSSGNSSGSGSSKSLTASLLLGSLHQPLRLDASTLYQPDRCFCCRLSWRQRVIGFAVTGCMAAMLFISSVFSLVQLFLATPFTFTCLYLSSHACFSVSCCFLVGPAKSYMSVLQSKRRGLAALYVGLLLLLLWCSLILPSDGLTWLAVVPLWLAHLATFVGWSVLYSPLSTPLLRRALALAGRDASAGCAAGVADAAAGCCSRALSAPYTEL